MYRCTVLFCDCIVNIQIDHTYTTFYSLPRFKDVWSYAQALDNASCWNELAEATIYHLNIELGTIIITQIISSVYMLFLDRILSS